MARNTSTAPVVDETPTAESELEDEVLSEAGLSEDADTGGLGEAIAEQEATESEDDETPSEPTAEELEAQRVAAEAEAKALAEAKQAHVAAIAEAFEPYMDERVRVRFDGRKMTVPGRLSLDDDGHVILTANWGLHLDLTVEPARAVETKNVDSGRFEQRAKIAA